jgi:hypothetical protein
MVLKGGDWTHIPTFFFIPHRCLKRFENVMLLQIRLKSHVKQK